MTYLKNEYLENISKEYSELKALKKCNKRSMSYILIV